MFRLSVAVAGDTAATAMPDSLSCLSMLEESLIAELRVLSACEGAEGVGNTRMRVSEERERGAGRAGSYRGRGGRAGTSREARSGECMYRRRWAGDKARWGVTGETVGGVPLLTLSRCAG